MLEAYHNFFSLSRPPCSVFGFRIGLPDFPQRTAFSPGIEAFYPVTVHTVSTCSFIRIFAFPAFP